MVGVFFEAEDVEVVVGFLECVEVSEFDSFFYDPSICPLVFHVSSFLDLEPDRLQKRCALQSCQVVNNFVLCYSVVMFSTGVIVWVLRKSASCLRRSAARVLRSLSLQMGQSSHW